jgi:hypothetical protein
VCYDTSFGLWAVFVESLKIRFLKAPNKAKLSSKEAVEAYREVRLWRPIGK